MLGCGMILHADDMPESYQFKPFSFPRKEPDFIKDEFLRTVPFCDAMVLVSLIAHIRVNIAMWKPERLVDLRW